MIRLGNLSGRVPNRPEMEPQTFLDGIAGIYYHQIWETSREIFNVSGTGNVGAMAMLTEPRHKGSKDTAAGRQRHKTPTRKHVSVSERGSNNSSVSPQTSDQQNLARAPPYSTYRSATGIGVKFTTGSPPHTNKQNVFVSSEMYLADIDS